MISHVLCGLCPLYVAHVATKTREYTDSRIYTVILSVKATPHLPGRGWRRTGLCYRCTVLFDIGIPPVASLGDEGEGGPPRVTLSSGVTPKEKNCGQIYKE